ncbi:MAG: NAD-dependent epimerase/dehydratase family protein, partial [Myxococcota bacterium]
MRVAVTGANGFLGRHLTAALAAGGDEVVGISLERGALPAAIPFVAADIRDADAVARAIDDAAPDAVVHLAALSHVGESWRRIPDYYAVNIVGTANVARAARGRHWLFSSSAEVYGAVPEDEQPIAEDRPLAPRSPYALTKAVAESIALDAGAVVVRSFNLVGQGQQTSFALPSFAQQLAAIAKGGAPRVLRVGNLLARRDFVDVLDAVAAFRLLVAQGVAGTVYNLASGRAPSIAEMLDRLRAVSGVAASVEIEPERVRPLDVPMLCGDARRLGELGWRPERG